MAGDPITAALDLGGKLIERVFPDKAAQDAAKLKLIELQQNGDLAELTAKANIVLAEAKSEGFLAASWRPILMLTFGALIVARWMGWTAPNLSEAEYLKLWDIIQLGLGGYVIGRSAEKIVPQLAAALGNK